MEGIKVNRKAAGCFGRIKKGDCLGILADVGFSDLTIQKEKQIHISDDIPLNYLSAEELKAYKQRQRNHSITV